jgi:zinc transport system substrate-binding protein
LLFETNLNKVILMRILLFASLSLIINMLAGCKPQQSQDSRETIMVSILPQKYFVEKIAGDAYKIEVMVPPGSSPETYEPTAQQMKQVANSSLYFSIGHIDFELSLLRKIKSINPNIKFIDTSQGTNLISDHFHVHADGTVHHHGADPHIWLSTNEVKVQVKNIYNSIVEIDPENTEKYMANYESFLIEIENTDKEIQEILKGMEGKTILVYHPAFGYFARDYGLKQEAVEFEGKNPTAGHLKKIVDIAGKENIRTIFVQQEFEIEYSKAVAREINAEIVILDVLNEDWINSMVDIAKKIKASHSS